MTIQTGTVVTLEVERQADFGYFLTDGSEESILLHTNEVSETLEIGAEVEVFIYLDKEGRITATMTIPEIQVGRYGWAKVVSVKKEMGVFVDIGIAKDVLVSADDLPGPLHLWPKVGYSLYIALMHDKHGRLLGDLATEDVIGEITKKANKGVYNLSITGTIYRLLMVGSFMISEEGYRCFIHESERITEPRLGEKVTGRVIDLKEDGSLNVSLLPFKQDKMEEDSDKIYSYLVKRGGAMPYGDKTSPEDVQFHFGLSKGAFKRALGKLMKEGKIYQEEGWTYTSDRK